jgi:hypothetical protein
MERRAGGREKSNSLKAGWPDGMPDQPPKTSELAGFFGKKGHGRR